MTTPSRAAEQVGPLLLLAFSALVVVGVHQTTRADGSPVLAALAWIAIALLNGSTAVVTWRRTRLPFLTAFMALGALAGAALAIWLLTGGRFESIAPVGWLAVILVVTVLGGLLRRLEAKRHPRRWSQVVRHTRLARPWDFLVGGHIPDLRGEGRVEDGV
ncbi:MAG TPA: hypothetical protein VMV46_05285 [Thermoanaerobaculia bacterium]|nr:hypothetical protein [Thermoanaerobaculia bacterium]